MHSDPTADKNTEQRVAAPVDAANTRSAAALPFTPTAVSDAKATPATPESQLAKNEAIKEEAENRRTRLASNLLEQKHAFIGNVGGIILAVIVGLYCIFGVSLGALLWSGKAFSRDLPVTAVVLVGMAGSVPTILSISLLVGLFAKDRESSKDEKSTVDAGTIAKACLDVIKILKTPH